MYPTNEISEKVYREDLEFIKNETLAQQKDGRYCKFSKNINAVIVYNMTEEQYIGFWRKQYLSNKKLQQGIKNACIDKLHNNTISILEMIGLIINSKDVEKEKKSAINALLGIKEKNQ